MAQKSYGSITIIDVTDLGEFSVYPMSNSPLTVIHNPDTNVYTPDWSGEGSALTINPVCYYAGQETHDVNVTWTVQENNGAVVDISSSKGEVMTSTVGSNYGKLTVSKNRFKETTGLNILTYYVTAVYTEPESKQTLTAKGQISFSLIRQASNVKTCDITGENIFKYNTSQSLITSPDITLTGHVTNVTITKWQYKNANGVYVDYPSGTITGNTLTVNANHNVFNNDVATIKLVTSDESVFDVFGVYKLRDGAAGKTEVGAVLSNEDQMIPCDSSGTPVTGAYNGAETVICIYRGGEDITSSWTITATPTNITGTWDSNTHKYTVTGISAETGYVTFTCTHTEYDTIIKTFNLSKIKTGADGQTPTIYFLEPSTLAINKNSAGVYTPSTVVFNAYSQTGTSARTAYAGRFKYYENGEITAKVANTTDATSWTYTPQAGLKSIKVELYTAGGGGNAVDTQSVIVTSDGTSVSITSKAIEYQTSTSGTITPTGTWSTTVPSVTKGQYLWTRTTVNYSDGKSTESLSVSYMGTNGSSTYTHIRYSANADGTDFVASPTSTTKYIGVYTGTSSTAPTGKGSYTWSQYVGNDGADGNGINSITYYYKTTTTKDAPNASDITSTTIPETSTTNKYLWQKEVIDFTDSTIDDKTTVSLLAVHGETGAKGDNSANVVIGNYADSIPCTSGGRTSAATTITIPFSGYYGITKYYTKAEIISGGIYGTSTTTALTPAITNATSTAEGKIEWTIPSNSYLATAASTKTGTVTIKYTVTNGTVSAGSTTYATISQTYTWTKSIAGTNATAVFSDIYAPNGDIINNGENDVVLKARVISNGTDVTSTSGNTFTWSKYENGSYVAISGATTDTLTVTSSMVDGYASFRCIINYSSKDYTSYYSVQDKSDPLQVYVYSTIGNQILNGVGSGAVFAVVSQNGDELDPAPEIVNDITEVSSTASSCYVIDVTNKKLIHKTKTSSGAWTNSTPSTICSYNWTFRDRNGDSITLSNTGDSKNKQAIYIDGTLITKKIIIDVDVTK